jgi:hypothetical protein
MSISGYPTQAPPPQYAEAAGPVKTQQREEKGCIEGWYELNSIFHSIMYYSRYGFVLLIVLFSGFVALRLCAAVGCARHVAEEDV